MRDHLFISYAGEDSAFVEWLTLRLVAEGYSVWCDRVKLLGGESYPRDIDVAIKSRTSRFLAVLSRHSINKPNPVKERTLAFNLERVRQEGFVIPLNLDGLSATDLDWMTSDITFIPFYLGWAAGLAQLLKRLTAFNIPRTFQSGRSAAAAWFESKDLVLEKSETLWSNIAQVIELPNDFYQYEIDRRSTVEQREELLAEWPFIEDGQTLWSFIAPSDGQKNAFSLRRVNEIKNWQCKKDDKRIRAIAARLLNESFRSACLSKGLKFTPDKKYLYFPDGLVTGNRLPFMGYDQRLSWIAPVGVRTFRIGLEKERSRYYLVPVFRTWLDHGTKGAVQVRLRLFFTTLEGTALEAKSSLQRRKAICKNWWNYEWLARTLAMFQFIAGDNLNIQIGTADGQQFVIAKYPITLGIDRSLDETKITEEIPIEEAEPELAPDDREA